jgi:hypothetical protein
MITARAIRRRATLGRSIVLRLLLLGSLLTVTGGCMRADSSNVAEVDWDLRTPTTPRSLGGDEDLVTKRAARGETLSVRIQLPGERVLSGQCAWIDALVVANPDPGSDAPIGTLALHNRRSDFAALRRFTDDFRSTYAMASDEAENLDAFLAKAELLEANGAGVMSWGTELTHGFRANSDGSFEPALTIVVSGDNSYDSYAVFNFDPYEDSPPTTPQAPSPDTAASQLTSDTDPS